MHTIPGKACLCNVPTVRLTPCWDKKNSSLTPLGVYALTEYVVASFPRSPVMPGCPLSPHQGLTLAEVVTDAVLDAACAWLCQQRKDWPADADV